MLNSKYFRVPLTKTDQNSCSSKRLLAPTLMVLFLVLIPHAHGAMYGPKATKHHEARPKIRYTSLVREITAALHISPGRWKMIICHHSAIETGNAAIYDREHRRRGMENGLAYHFVIGNGSSSGDGEIEIGSRWIRQIKGGHVRSDELNDQAIGICLVGNFENHRPTKKQIEALKELLLYLRDDVLGGRAEFLVHTEADPNHTLCPGRYFPTRMVRRYFGTARHKNPERE
ncbi:peptidoglycan-binding protein [Opitutaceae bacterium EW11]|nr:peptidoglycan-binding protein [Opitutaceae bacterium EW11]